MNLRLKSEKERRGRRHSYLTDDAKWRAVVEKDGNADGKFYYSVKTTGVYCLPSCPARSALRKNVAFHDTPEDAEKAGFRAGDVIVKVNGESISDSGDFTHAMHGRKSSTVNVSIIREKKEQTLTLALPERNQSKVLDESYEVPEVDAETVISDARSELARVAPEMETVLEIRPDLEGAKRDLRAQQQELKKAMRELQRKLLDEETQIQKNIKHGLWRPQADI